MKQQFYSFDDFKWNGINIIDYKVKEKIESVNFKGITRQNLFMEENTDFHLRYFQIEPKGYSSLEKHEHVHVVVAVRGTGKIVIDDALYKSKPLDLIVVPSFAMHQFINESDEPFGFFCIVDANRDKPQKLDDNELESLLNNPMVKNHVQT